MERKALSLSLSLSRRRALKRIAAGILTLAVVATGGFLLAENQDKNAQATAPTGYTTVIEEDFNRADVTTTAEIGNNWSNTGTSLPAYQISDGMLLMPATNSFDYANRWNGVPLVQPDVFLYGKSQVKVDVSAFETEGEVVALIGAYNPITRGFYAGWVYKGASVATGGFAPMQSKLPDYSVANGLWGWYVK